MTEADRIFNMAIDNALLFGVSAILIQPRELYADVCDDCKAWNCMQWLGNCQCACHYADEPNLYGGHLFDLFDD